jgi:hypothetical protein
MRAWILTIGVAAMIGPGLGTAHAQEPAPVGCEVPIAIEPVDRTVMKLLSTPVMPPFQTSFTAVSMRPIKQWDLPSKVTRWQDRPGAADLSQRWADLGKSWYKTGGIPEAALRPYAALTVPPKEWEELRQWMAKDGSKQLAGTCVVEKNARYVMVVGEIRDASLAGGSNATRDTQYAEYSGTPRQDNIGPGVGTVSSTAHQSSHDELASRDATSDPSVYACVFLYRAEAAQNGDDSGRASAPAYYYCHEASTLKSSVSAMLKFLAKNGLP